MTDETEGRAAAVAAVRRWIDDWGAEVAAVQLDAGRRRFADDVVAFGTKADVVRGLDHVYAQQWSKVWPNIADFAFHTDQLVVQLADDRSLAVAIVPWGSTGFHADGTSYDRPGRATVVLERVPGGDAADPAAWRAIHTHFSLTLDTPAHTFGRPAGD